MHAAKVSLSGRGKRKRGAPKDHGGDTNSTVLPPLTFPTLADIDSSVFQPVLTLTTTAAAAVNRTGAARGLVSLVVESKRVAWIEQCHGCGCEVHDPDQACVLSMTLYVLDETAEAQDEVVLFFCTSDCMDQKGVPAWTEASRKWAQNDASSAGLVLKTRRSDELSWQDSCKSCK